MPTPEQLRIRLSKKLKELFQLDQPDLDFGFYRIMHAKARQVHDFIDKDLLKIVEDAFGRVDETRKAELQVNYDKALQTAREYGAPNPEETEPVKKAKAALDAAKDTVSSEGDIYDHLYRFFERYYDNGDFISRRYYTRETSGKAAPFAVPYNGEEVKLHWANADQYYIKTAEYFSNFTFDIRQAKEIQALRGSMDLGEDNIPMAVHFRIVQAAEGEHGNVKASEATKRYFIIHKEKMIEATGNGELVVNFEYRPDPEKTGQENTWREKRNTEAVESILAKLDEMARSDNRAKDYLRLLSIPAPTESDRKRPLLAKYINQYTARNTMDYFIHKDLGGFLRRELDFYIKNEVMHIDDIENADIPAVETYIGKLKVLRTIAGKIIDFLAQLENFQKKLWLKKKFVIETNYCITLDRIPEEFYPEIAANQAQHDEWIKLFAIDEIEADDTGNPGYANPLNVEFLKANNKLILDTQFFDEAFKSRIISNIENFDEQCDGLLIHSENFQALNLLREYYREQIKCIYIDPPYNTSEESFVYKNSYRHSSWITMVTERVNASRPLNQSNGAIIVTIDDEELYHLKEALATVYSDDGYIATIVVQSNPRGRGINRHYATSHEYCLIFSLNSDNLVVIDQPLTDEQAQGYGHGDGEQKYRLLPFRRSGGLSAPDERPNSEFSLYYSKSQKKIVAVGGERSMDYPAVYMTNYVYMIGPDGNIISADVSMADANEDLIKIMPLDSNGKRRVWRWSDRRKILKAAMSDEFVVKNTEGRPTIQLKDWIKNGRKPKTIWQDSKYDASSHGTNLLANITGDRKQFGYPKSIYSTHDAIHTIIGEDETAICLDYFGGSGTTGEAVVVLNREDEGSRRYILIEIGDYFDTVLKPRMAKVVYSETWKDGKPTARETGISHCFKYLRLESYEDTLNNLRFDENQIREKAITADPSLREDFMLHYLLDVETRGSQSVLNIDAFVDPTAYALKVKIPGSDQYEVKAIDLIETFNYLIGLRVNHIDAPQTFSASFKRLPDPELPDDQHTKLVLDGKIRQNAEGHWWFRKIEGWVPSDPANPNNGHQDKVLIVWRKLTNDLEKDNLMLDEWFQKNRISTRDFEFDTIYVNGSNNLPNLALSEDTWKVRLIEEEFMKRMWDVEAV